jgi:hypothetical protein
MEITREMLAELRDEVRAAISTLKIDGIDKQPTA